MPENEEISEFLTSFNAITVIFNRGRYLHKICISLHCVPSLEGLQAISQIFFGNLKSRCASLNQIYIFLNMRHSGIETVQSLVKACQ